MTTAVADFIHVLCYLYLGAWAVRPDDGSRWSLYVEYDTWIVFRGRSDDEPSPVKSACRKTRLNACEPCQTCSGIRFAALR